MTKTDAHAIQASPKLATALISMYAKCGGVSDAFAVFDSIPPHQRDVVAWTTILKTLIQHGKVEESMEMLDEMLQSGTKPDLVAWSVLFSACGKAKAATLGKKLFDSITVPSHLGFVFALTNLFFSKSGGTLADVTLATAVIAMHAKCGSIADAQAAFESIPLAKRDKVAWTAMMSGLAQCGRVEEALDLCKQMQQQNIRPDVVTWAVLFHACGEAKALAIGKQLHKGMWCNVVAV